MRVLFLGITDWANVSNRVARGMNAAAGEQIARVVTTRAHPLGYREDHLSVTEGLHWTANADWIITTGDGEHDAFLKFLAAVEIKENALKAAAHVGTAYRLKPGFYNKTDRQYFNARFIGGDLYRFADDPNAIPYFAPPDFVMGELTPVRNKIRIGHSPTTRASKGSAGILRVLDEFKDRIDVDLIEGVPYEECVARRAQCHIFIDQMNPAIGGYGASAVEGLASGCAVLADIRHVITDVDRFYPRPPILDVHSKRELRDALTFLLDPINLKDYRERSLRWAHEVASPKAVGAYWLKHLKRIAEEAR